MASLIKRAKRGVRRKTGDFLQGTVVGHAPDSIRKKLGPALCYFEMLVLDYGIVRSVYANQHEISPEAWRSAQPTPAQIGKAARAGIKTIVNLRGDQSFGTNWLEQRACEKYGLTLVNFRLRSRAAPSLEELHAIRALLERIEYPVLLHCKSGADRAGLMSAIYKIVRQGAPVEEAKQQLSLKYGHIRQADTGVLDYFFERYIADNAKAPIGFWEWVDSRYDPDEVNRTFRANGFANRLVNGILRRE